MILLYTRLLLQEYLRVVLCGAVIKQDTAVPNVSKSILLGTPSKHHRWKPKPFISKEQCLFLLSFALVYIDL